MKPDWRLFRFLDFDVEPGHSYRYRVRLALRNPAWKRGEPNEAIETPWSKPSLIVVVGD